MSSKNDKFIWDPDKYLINHQKHGITFDEATTVFSDDSAIYLVDNASSDFEDRFIVIGFSSAANMLMVCHCYRNGDNFVRLISARKANKAEAKLYLGGKV